MSGLDLLLRTAIDYELTHQAALYALFENSNLPDLLIGIPRTQPTEWEPEQQLFDLGIAGEASRVLVEIKMWASLSKTQLDRQVSFLKSHGIRGGYVLLGTSWFELDDVMLHERTEGLGMRLGYEELVEGLNHLLEVQGLQRDAFELALAYRNALEFQFKILTNAAYSSQTKDNFYYYSLFWFLKQKLPEFGTRILTTTNPRGKEYILQNLGGEQLVLNDVKIYLYYEVVNDKLRIKFSADTHNEMKRPIRDMLRRAAHAILDEQFKIIDIGRLGEFMTVCRIEHDFSILADMERSVTVFAAVGRSLRLIADKARSS